MIMMMILITDNTNNSNQPNNSNVEESHAMSAQFADPEAVPHMCRIICIYDIMYNLSLSLSIYIYI